jgi:hypothetical protein
MQVLWHQELMFLGILFCFSLSGMVDKFEQITGKIILYV